MENVTNKKIWKRVGISIGVVLGLYAILVGIRTTQLFAEEATAKRVAAIHAIRLTMADVDGSKLPPEPAKDENDKTVAGVDVNGNYVRDDVERWIFAQYPNLEERAAWMQQARSVGLVMIMAKDKSSLKAIMEEGDRSNQCATKIYSRRTPKPSLGELNALFDQLDNQVLNTSERKAAQKFGYSFMTSSGPMEGPQCDEFSENG